MKKHIIGLMLFSFIVSAAAIIYGVLNILFPVPEAVSVFVPQHNQVERTHCKMKREIKEQKISSPLITQAVFDQKMKRFSWHLARSEAKSAIVLHFFISDAKGTRYIDSVSAESSIGDGELNYSPFYMNLDKIDSQANLYLIADNDADSTFNGFHEKRQPVEFDAGKAIAVTIDYGK